jgi:hypothetical protein
MLKVILCLVRCDARMYASLKAWDPNKARLSHTKNARCHTKGLLLWFGTALKKKRYSIEAPSELLLLLKF